MRNIKLLVAITLVLTLVLATAIGCATTTVQPEDTEEHGEVEAIEETEETKAHVEAVVSSHHLATEAGIEILAAGGTAADAAVTVAAVMSVVEPFYSSALGGGTWAVYHDADTGDVTSLDGVGPVGSKATVEDYSARGGRAGMHQSVVPGAWDGWMLWLEEYGVLDLDVVLAPAIRIAREGFPISTELANWMNFDSRYISGRPDTARIYMPEGKMLKKGDTIYQHDMADTFEALADEYNSKLNQGRSEAIQAARDYYYRGPLAEAIVDFSDKNDGYLTLEDFNGFEAEIVDSISIQYNDQLEVFQSPPNSQGITMLIALNILKGYDFSQYGPDDAEAVHLQVEAIKLAFADMYYYIGDPRRVDIPIDQLLSDEHAENQRERIVMDTALKWPIADGLAANNPASTNTTAFHVVDKHGNAAAVTTSIGAQFMVIGDTGIHINNRMRMICTEDGNPNQLAPGYKVRHTSNPYLAFKNGELYIVGANTGADNQPQGQVQQFIAIAEFGIDAQEAVSRPRFFSTAHPSLTFPYQVENKLYVHHGYPEAIINKLKTLGHDVQVGGVYGSAHVIVIEDSGLNARTGAEPRNDASLGIVNPAETQ